MRQWQFIGRAHGLVTHATTDAVILIETPRSVVGPSDLADAISRLAPNVRFGPVERRHEHVERSAIVDGERVTIGRLVRGAWTVTYLVRMRGAVPFDDIVAAHLGETSSPFDHLAD